MQALKFSFENHAVRTIGEPDLPLFIALDVCGALGHTNPRKAIKDHVDPEDIIKAEITDSMNRKQTVNCVNESGLYALIFGSKLESAKRFKKWVTSEVLPAIRRTGRYECPVVASQTIDAAQQLAIRNAIAHRAKTTSAHYRTIYNALYDAFQVPRYTELKAADFDDAIRFIEAYALPQLAAPADRITLTREEANAFLSVAYQLKYLFRDPYRKFAAFLNAVGSPMSGQFFDAFNDMAVDLMAGALERNGMRIEDLDCYRYWAMKH
jgi:prophage antirepressor-like protein